MCASASYQEFGQHKLKLRLEMLKKYCVTAGVLLAKMTPFRSCLVIVNTALAIAILGEVRVRGGVTTYAIVRPFLPCLHTPCCPLVVFCCTDRRSPGSWHES